MCTLKYPILLKCLCLLILNIYLQVDKSTLPVSIYKLPAAPQTFVYIQFRGSRKNSWCLNINTFKYKKRHCHIRDEAQLLDFKKV